MVTVNDYLMGRELKYPVTFEIMLNAIETVDKVNKLLEEFKQDRAVTSGYRPAAINSTVKNAAPNSKHMTCQACDLEDKDGKLDKFCMENQDVLARIGLWLEHPSSTIGWCHVQIVPPKSGNRVFYP